MQQSKLDRFINDMLSILSYKFGKKKRKTKKPRKSKKKYPTKESVLAELNKRKKKGYSNRSLELAKGVNRDRSLWIAARFFGIPMDVPKKCINGHDISEIGSKYTWKRNGTVYKRCKECHRKNNKNTKLNRKRTHHK